MEGAAAAPEVDGLSVDTLEMDGSAVEAPGVEGRCRHSTKVLLLLHRKCRCCHTRSAATQEEWIEVPSKHQKLTEGAAAALEVPLQHWKCHRCTGSAAVIPEVVLLQRSCCRHTRSASAAPKMPMPNHQFTEGVTVAAEVDRRSR